MNNLTKKILMLFCCLGLSTTLWANDIITFTWKGGENKIITLKATTGTNNVVVNWGNGDSTFCDGADFSFVSIPSYAYVDTQNYNVTIRAVNTNTRLTYLQISSQKVSTLDVKNASALTNLYCYINQLTTLDVSNNVALISLSCYSNQLTNIDISNNTALVSLTCYSNQLSSLDLSNNTKLTSILCYSNQLTSLDVSNNTLLREFQCSSNQLTSLDLSNNTALYRLYCHENQLTSLDMSSTIITDLGCWDNQLSRLMIGDNRDFTYIGCYSNALPLINLYDISEKVSTESIKKLGTQTLSIENCLMNFPIVIDSVFNGYNTVFTVTRNGYTAIVGTEYTITNGEITFLKTGKFDITITNPGIVSDISSPAKVIARFEVKTELNVSDILLKNTIIYPNPAKDVLYVQSLSEIENVSVCDINGRALKRLFNSNQPIDISDLANGIYLVKINTPQGEIIKKIIKQ